MKKNIGLLICFFVGVISLSTHAQNFSVASGTNFSILATTPFAADSIDMTPSADFILNGTTLSRAIIVVNNTATPYIKRVYQFSAATNAFSGTIKLFYINSNLNGLTESSLKLLLYNGTSWSLYNNSTVNTTSKFVENNSLSAVSLKEITAGACSPNTGDTTATACGSFVWYGNTYSSSASPTRTFTNVTGCDSVVTLHLTINSVPTAPSGTGGARCSTGTVSISATPSSGETIDWYAALSGGAVLTSGSGVTSFTTPSISTTTQYYAQARNTTTGCLSASRTAVTATVDATATVSSAGSDQSLCNTSTFTLAGNSPTSGTGAWSLVSGTSTITTPSSATTTVTSVPTNTNITLRWTVTNGTCSSTDDVIIRNDASATASAAGSDQFICNTSTFTLAANSPSSGIGAWSFIGSSGSASITNSSLQTSTVTSVPSSTDIILRWTITNGTCTSTDDVAIKNNPVTTSTVSAGGPTTFNYGGSVQLSGVLTVPSEGNALSLNGTSNYVSIPSGINSNFSANQITIEGWFYPTQSFPKTALIGETFEGDGKIKFALFSEDAGGGVQNIRAGFYSPSTDWVQVTSSANFSFNQWTHIAATYDQTNVKIYVNGALTCTLANTNALPTGSERWLLGKKWDEPNYFPGKMDEIRIWNVARTQTQIQNSMNSTISPTTSGLVGYYKMDEASGNSAADATGHGYTGTVN